MTSLMENLIKRLINLKIYNDYFGKDNHNVGNIIFLKHIILI